MTPLALAAFERLSKFVFGDLEQLARQTRDKAPIEARSIGDVWELRGCLLSLSDSTRFAAYEIDTMRFEEEVELGLRKRYVIEDCQITPSIKERISIDEIFSSI